MKKTRLKPVLSHDRDGNIPKEFASSYVKAAWNGARGAGMTNKN